MKAQNIKNDTEPKDNINLEVKIPKKRGRKPKNKLLLESNNTATSSDNNSDKNVEEVVKPKKKRGRKPKNTTGIVEVKIPKKRGRKPNILNSSSNNKIINNSNQMTDNILHLKVSSNEINDNMITENIYKYNPDINTPLPYEPINNSSEPATLKFVGDNKEQNLHIENNYNQDLHTKLNNNLDNNEVETKEKLGIKNESFESIINIERKDNIDEEPKIMKEIDYKNKKKNIKPIMFYYNEFNKRNEWPKFSNIKCLWCCHNFDCVPCAIPIKLKHGNFYVFGNFCSKECAASYNFDSNENKNVIWERYTLLNYLYSIIEDEPDLTIKLAPSRLTLEAFGGYLDIKEFRNTGNTKEYNIIYPPIQSIIP